MIAPSLYGLGARFIGLSEQSGTDRNDPLIMAMLKLDNSWPSNDEVPWCSAYLNFVAHLLDLPRTRNLCARSWLEVGVSIDPLHVTPMAGDICVLARGGTPTDHHKDEQGNWYSGHVGIVHAIRNGAVELLGGNQGNSVSIAPYSLNTVLDFRRLHEWHG